MRKQISKIATSLKEIGEIQVNDWDFMALLNKDLKDIEFTRSLRKLANIQVMEWDFRTVLPAVSKLAHQQIDIVDLVKRTANYKVMEWDFRSAQEVEPAPESESPEATESVGKCLNQEEIQVLVGHLKNFLRYVATNLIDEPDHARIKAEEIAPNVFRFSLVLVKRDVPVLIGKDGQTATTIRNILKAAAGKHGVHALLQIHSHE
jgi:predicted RNA-binding protein YlqC (UPF0109 family)